MEILKFIIADSHTRKQENVYVEKKLTEGNYFGNSNIDEASPWALIGSQIFHATMVQ